MKLIIRTLVHVHKTFFELISSSRAYRLTTIVSVVLVIATFLLPIWKLVPLSAETKFIPLHYNIYFGIDRFGPWYQVLVLPVIGFVLLIINTIFQAVFYHRERVLSHFFAVTNILAQVALFVSMVFIVLLNI